jgi:hypothetical protein
MATGANKPAGKSKRKFKKTKKKKKQEQSKVFYFNLKCV